MGQCSPTQPSSRCVLQITSIYCIWKDFWLLVFEILYCIVPDSWLLHFTLNWLILAVLTYLSSLNQCCVLSLLTPGSEREELNGETGVVVPEQHSLPIKSRRWQSLSHLRQTVCLAHTDCISFANKLIISFLYQSLQVRGRCFPWLCGTGECCPGPELCSCL